MSTDITSTEGKVLTDEQIVQLAFTDQQGPVYHLNNGEEDYDLDLSEYSPEQIERINAYRREEEAKKAAADAEASKQNAQQNDPPEDTIDATVSEATIDELDGYTLVGSTNVNHDDGDAKFAFDDLLPTTVIEHLNGVSVSLDKPAVSSNHGTMRARLINDAGGRAYIYRKDDAEAGQTTFKVAFRYMDA